MELSILFAVSIRDNTIARVERRDSDNLGQIVYLRPHKFILVLFAIQAVSQPDTPDDIAIRPEPSHQMPNCIVSLRIICSRDERQDSPPTMAL
jgi:hypothetical protein